MVVFKTDLGWEIHLRTAARQEPRPPGLIKASQAFPGITYKRLAVTINPGLAGSCPVTGREASYGAGKLSTSERVGIDGCAPTRLTEIAAAR